MNTQELLSELRNSGIKLSTDGERLRCNAPKDTLTPILRSQLAERKAEIIQLLQNSKLTDNTTCLPIERISREQNLPLSFAQQRLWFLDQLEPFSPFYNISKAVSLKGDLKIQVLEQALNAIVAHHEVLRTNYVSDNGKPIQVIAAPQSVELKIIDLQQYEKEECEIQLKKILQQESQRPFNLESDLMLRSCLLQLAPQEHVLLLIMHHIASDGWSVGVLRQQLTQLYEAFLKGKPNPLAELLIQYADYAVWHRKWLSGELLDKQLDYWKQQLAGANPLLELPTDKPRPAIQTYNGASQFMELPESLSDKLKKLCPQQGVTLYMVLLAAFQTLLYRYSGQEDIIVGSPIAGRDTLSGSSCANPVEIEGLIGFFVNTLALRTDLSGNPSFLELLHKVQQVALEAYTHQDVPFEKLVEELQLERSLSYSPLFQVMFILQNTPKYRGQLLGLTETPMQLEAETAKFDLTVSLMEKDGIITGSWNYNSDLFERTTITRMMEHFHILLEGIVENPQLQISQLPLLNKAERHQLLVEWNNIKTNYPSDMCIHQLFEEQVERTPDAVAVVFENKKLTYRQLNQKANQLAHYLRWVGVDSDTLVGICVERSLEMLVGVLGILKAGGAYVPLDPSYPKERIAYMLEDSGVFLLLTQKKLSAILPEHTAKTIYLDTDLKTFTGACHLNPNSITNRDNLAYAIYTSGSTGKPKCVGMKHLPLTNLIKWHLKNIRLPHQVNTLQFAPISFDVSFQEIFSTWCAGGTLILIPEKLRTDPVALLDLLIEKQVQRLFLPFVALQQLAESAQSKGLIPQSLHEVITAGEQLQITPAITNFFSQLKDCTLHNHYGPSETHVVTAFSLTGSPKNWSELPPIGTPIDNTQIYILDTHLQPVPINVPGELYIGGAALARGYLNRPEVTSQKFIPNPFSKEPNARLYKTGDLARYLPDGNIQYIGRIDNQVKIRGFRIELGEIESVLNSHPQINQAIVIVREDIPGNKRLVAYLVKDDSLTTKQLREILKQKLPEYMIPSIFVTLDKFPLTPSGKVNRRILPAPDLSKLQLENHFVPPSNSTEEILAKIWVDILGLDKVGIHDNFFDLGGHSLLAVRLVAEIEKVIQKKLPLAALFQFTTISELANHLQDEPSASTSPTNLSPELPSLDTEDLRTLLTIVSGREALRIRPDSLMSAIRSTGSKPPIFYFANSVDEISPLAQHLDPEQPIYLLESGYLVFYNQKKYTEDNIKAIAARHVRDILTLSPEGPYLLTGYSFGKFVAYEAAKQLQELGKEVALLAILDTSGSRWMYHYYVQKLQPALVDIKHDLFRGSLFNFTRKSFSLIWQFKKDWKTQNSVLCLEKDKREYKLQGYSGKITLFVAQNTRRHVKIQRRLFPLLGWDKNKVNVIKVPGNHWSMVEEPNVNVLADNLKTCIEKAMSGI